MKQPRKQWDKEEQLLALRLYFQLPFGQLHQRQPDVIKVAEAIGRTPSAVAMKACNFASLDPALDRKGLGNISNADKELWQEFMENSEQVANIAEELYQQVVLDKQPSESEPEIPQISDITETKRLTKVRRVQSFFRKSVLVSYENKCAITGISDTRFIIASHIIPWKDNEKRRADPTNGIALNSLHDRLFDQGLMTFDENYRVVLSDSFKKDLAVDKKYKGFMDIEGERLKMPGRFQPDNEALDYHRKKVFIAP